MTEETTTTTTTDAPASTETTTQPTALESTGSEFNFRDHLSDNYKEKYTEFKDIDGLMKGYDNLAQKLGTNPIVKPNENATDEEKFAYKETLFKELGRPETADGYEISFGDDMPEGFINDEHMQKIQGIAHREGVSQQALDAIVKEHTSFQLSQLNELQNQNQQSIEQGTQELKQKWGNEYDQKLGEVNQFYQNYMQDAPAEAVQKYGNDPYFLDMVHKLSEKTKSDQSKFVGQANTANSIRDDQAEMQTVMMKDSYNNVMHAEHAKDRARVKELAARITQLQNG